MIFRFYLNPTWRWTWYRHMILWFFKIQHDFGVSDMCCASVWQVSVPYNVFDTNTTLTLTLKCPCFISCRCLTHSPNWEQCLGLCCKRLHYREVSGQLAFWILMLSHSFSQLGTMSTIVLQAAAVPLHYRELDGLPY